MADWDEEGVFIKTSLEVWKEIHKIHIDRLAVFASYSTPKGDEFGNSSIAVMETCYGFKESDYPLIKLRTTWDVDRQNPHLRKNEKTVAWLYCQKEKPHEV